MIGLIEAGIAAVTEGLKLANTVASRKYIAELHDLRLERQKEKAKGQLADDLKIQRIDEKIKICWDSCQQEIALANSKK